MKEWRKCQRCEDKFEKLYLVPYLTNHFIEWEICRDCSMTLHDRVKDLVYNFLHKHSSEPSGNSR